MCINIKCDAYFTMSNNLLQNLWIHSRPSHLRNKRMTANVWGYMWEFYIVCLVVLLNDMLDLCQYFGHKKLNFSPSITYAERIIS